MTEAQEVRARAKAPRGAPGGAGEGLAGAGAGCAPLRLELARVKGGAGGLHPAAEGAMPSHKVRRRTTWAGVDGWRWDDLQYQTWAELESAGEHGRPHGAGPHAPGRPAGPGAGGDGQAGGVSGPGGGGKKPPRWPGRRGGTGDGERTVGRGRPKIAREAKALYEVLQAQQGRGRWWWIWRTAGCWRRCSPADAAAAAYLYLYYGEWLSLREIGRSLRVDHAWCRAHPVRAGASGGAGGGNRAEVRGWRSWRSG